MYTFLLNVELFPTNKFVVILAWFAIKFVVLDVPDDVVMTSMPWIVKIPSTFKFLSTCTFPFTLRSLNIRRLLLNDASRVTTKFRSNLASL